MLVRSVSYCRFLCGMCRRVDLYCTFVWCRLYKSLRPYVAICSNILYVKSSSISYVVRSIAYLKSTQVRLLCVEVYVETLFCARRSRPRQR